MDYTKLASPEILAKTQKSLTDKGYDVSIVSDKTAALGQIKKLIPPAASVMNGSSTTLKQIGYLDYLQTGTHGWKDLHAEITAESDAAKRHELRKLSSLSDYDLGSVHALTQDGEMLIASNSGSQLPHLVFTSPHLILVISTKKIVPNLDAAFARLNEHVYPLEDQRLMQAMNSHTAINKILVFKGEPAFSGRKVHIILIEEDLGF